MAIVGDDISSSTEYLGQIAFPWRIVQDVSVWQDLGGGLGFLWGGRWLQTVATHEIK